MPSGKQFEWKYSSIPRQWVKSAESPTQKENKLSLTRGPGFPSWSDPCIVSLWYPKGRRGAAQTRVGRPSASEAPGLVPEMQTPGPPRARCLVCGAGIDMVSKHPRWFWFPVKLEKQSDWLDRTGAVWGRALYFLRDFGHLT